MRVPTEPALRALLAGWRRAKKEGRAPSPEEKVARNTYTKTWRKRRGAEGRRRAARYMRLRRRRNAKIREKEQAAARARFAKHGTTLRKTAIGRSCDSCGKSDAEVFWSTNKKYCSACEKRSRTNGVCEECGEARYATNWIRHAQYGPVSVSGRGIPVCSCTPEVTTKEGERGLEIPEGAITLAMDMLTVAGSHDEIEGFCSTLHLRDLVRVFKVSVRTVQRYKIGEALRAAQAFDPAAHVLARPFRLVFDRRTLEQAVKGVS